MRGSLAIRVPVQKAYIDMSSTNVTTSAYVTLISSLSYGVSAMELFNPSAATMKIAIGTAGSEVDMNYYVLPGGSAFLIPLPAGHSQRVSIRAVDQTAASGLFVINCFA